MSEGHQANNGGKHRCLNTIPSFGHTFPKPCFLCARKLMPESVGTHALVGPSHAILPGIYRDQIRVPLNTNCDPNCRISNAQTPQRVPQKDRELFYRHLSADHCAALAVVWVPAGASGSPSWSMSDRVSESGCFAAASVACAADLVAWWNAEREVREE